MLKIEVISLFPELFQGFFTTSLIGKAVEGGSIEFNLSQLRNFSDPPHFRVDDTPYGGGPGMIISPEPAVRAIRSARHALPNARVICPSASGAPFRQADAIRLAKASELIFICPRYEGLDQRAIDLEVDDEFCLGEAVVMGGESPVMMMLEAIIRLLPGVLGNSASVSSESFSPASEALLEAPQYTKPQEFEGKRVPEALLSGDHQRIIKWRVEKGRELAAKRGRLMND